MTRLIAFAALLFTVTACSPNDLDRPPVPLGDFALGYNVVVAPDPVVGPASRVAEPEAWITAVEQAIEARFRRYEGKRLYHFGVTIDGYVLAQPGIPLIFSPNSALIIQITVWDDAKQAEMNEDPHQITVLEPISGNTVLGSGNTQTKEEQMTALAAAVSKEIERWLVERNEEDGWFVPVSVPDPGIAQDAELVSAEES